MDQQGGLRAVVGHAGTEHFALDLRMHGPHALVGGTTGAGKSEFLQAWVLGLAHAYSPDRVTFLFIDYKGGSAFAHCDQLPHSVGLFSDLSPYLVRRALRSLGAEIHFREHLLNRKGKKDLIDLELTGDPECPPSLIIVVDEFAALKREIPEFLDGMIDIAQRGRSLGLHLVLATQRPAGVIDDNLRANTNLRIALRLADDADSVDVVGDKVAARFSPSRPGRAVAKTGPGRLIPFQAGYPGAKSPDVPPKPPIHISDLDFGTGRAWPMPDRGGSGEDVESDAVRIVRTIRRAAEVASVPTPRKPWLPTLADAYDLSRLGPRRDSEVVLGLVDVPSEQQQRREYFRPDVDGNIVFLGASGSGKTTALRTVALAMSITPRGGPVHVYGVDYGGGGLRMLEPLPNVGSIILGEDTERIDRLLRELAAVATRRKTSFEAAHAGTLAEFRERAGQAHEPRILVLIDGFEAFRKDFEDRRGGQEIYEAFQRLIVDGRSRGIHFAVTTDRPVGMPSAVLAAFPRRIVLRLADSEAYGFLGVPKDVLHPASPPGRAVEIGRGLELQLAILGTSVATAEQAREIEQLVPTIATLVRERPLSIERLKLQLPAVEVPAVLVGRPVVGVSGRSLAPVSFDPGGVVLVVGPPRSGRTNAVQWLAGAVAAACPAVERIRIGTSMGRLAREPIWTASYGDLDDLAELLPDLTKRARTSAEHGVQIAIFVEGLADFENSPVESQIGDLIRACRRSGQLLIIEAEAAALRESYGLKRPAVESARGVLVLQPGPDDGDAFAKVSFPYGTGQLPVGRGYWTAGGSAQLVQIPEVG